MRLSTILPNKFALMKLKNQIRQKLTRIWWYSTLLFKGSDLFSLKLCDYLVVGHDHDKTFRFQSKQCSPILDFLETSYLDGNVEYIAKPGSKIKHSSFNTYRRVNVHYLIYRILFFVKGGDYAERAFWRFILNKTNPQYVLGIQIPPLMCMEATSRNIDTINLQHGMIQSDFDYYQYIKSDIELPSTFYCWDGISTEIGKNKFKNKEFKEIGHPLHNQFYNRNFAAEFYSKELKYLKEITKGKSVVCVSLQYDSKFNSNLVPKEVVETLNCLKSHDYIIAVRFHPIAIQLNGIEKLKSDFYVHNKLNFDDLNVIDASNFPLPLLLPFVNIHLTQNSAVFLESQIYGIKTYYWENDTKRLNELKDYEAFGALLFPIVEFDISKNIY